LTEAPLDCAGGGKIQVSINLPDLTVSVPRRRRRRRRRQIILI
jgi:hypothetical protein